MIIASAVANLQTLIRSHSGPVFLIAHSLGGAIALGAAEAQSSNLAGMIILDAGPRPTHPADLERSDTEIEKEGLILIPESSDPESSAAIGVWVAEMAKNRRDQARLVRDFASSNRDNLRAVLVDGRKLQLRLDPHKLTAPTLVLCAYAGSNDCAATLSDYKSRYMGFKEVTFHAISHSSHFLMLDHPQLVLDLVRSFLGQRLRGLIT
ncbi:MAG: alpha/beta hydrolase [Sphingosinicella sp.]|nr:alpha/beta hydrolase [Sphingosinicella sp.]